MQRRRLGNTGLEVSRLALGTMTWGRDTDEHEARDQLLSFLEAGGNFIDTADTYTDGRSEEIVGLLLSESVERSQVVIATKATSVPAPRRFNASRGHLLAALDRSLARLGVDYIDLWQLHAWDPRTPLDESLEAIDTAVKSGRVRYAGISNYSGWQLAQASTAQTSRHRAPIVTAQHEYSLLQRGVEREIVPAALALGIGILPWSPLGRGVLTGKYRTGIPSDSRGASTHFASFVQPFLGDRPRAVVDAVVTAADGLGVAPVEVALSWVRDRPGVVAPIVGARTAGQLRGALLSEELTLPTEIVDALDDVSAPPLGYPEAGWAQPQHLVRPEWNQINDTD
jgi:aryl-alcohol dehydrogenase-like predicted oxidoreductase